MKFYGAFEKVEPQDDGTIKVWGVASSEAVDGEGEIVMADAMRKALPEYMEFANVREMHGKIAAGVCFEANVDDDGKTRIGAHIVDPVSVKKVQTNVLKGFSIGGGHVERDKEIKKNIIGLRLTEISLVDRPCNPDARITLWKAEGINEDEPSAEELDGLAVLVKKYGGAESFIESVLAKVAAREDVNPKEGKEKYGDVKFADEKNKKYPIDTPAHIRAAWNYINKSKNAGKYDSGDLKTIKGKIVAAWKDKIDKDGPPSAEKFEKADLRKMDCEARAALLIDNPKAQTVLKSLAVMAGDKLEKGLWTVSRLAELIGNLFDVQCGVAQEAAYEGDGSVLPDELRDSVKGLGEILLHMVAEECEELYPEEEAPGFDSMAVQMAAGIANLQKASDSILEKAGAKHSAETMGHLQAMHDTLHKMTGGKVCAGSEKASSTESLAKAESAVAELTKASETAKAALHETQAALAKITEQRDLATVELEKAAAEIERLKKEPEPGGPALRDGLHVVTKSDDGKEIVSRETKADDGTVKVEVMQPGTHNPEAARSLIKARFAGGGQPFSPLS